MKHANGALVVAAGDESAAYFTAACEVPLRVLNPTRYGFSFGSVVHWVEPFSALPVLFLQMGKVDRMSSPGAATCI